MTQAEYVFVYLLLNMGASSSICLKTDKNLKQGNRGDMRKISVTGRFFRLVALRVTFSKKTKKQFLDMV